MSFKARNDPEGLPPEDSKGGWVLSDVIYILTNCELITRHPAIALFPVGLRKFLVYMESKGKKILIADDEPDILEIIQYNLSKEGYDVVTAKDGDEAVGKAKMTRPDLIILDIMMPKKNGVEVCEILRSQPAFKETLILSSPPSAMRALTSGAWRRAPTTMSPNPSVQKYSLAV